MKHIIDPKKIKKQTISRAKSGIGVKETTTKIVKWGRQRDINALTSKLKQRKTKRHDFRTTSFITYQFRYNSRCIWKREMSWR